MTPNVTIPYNLYIHLTKFDANYIVLQNYLYKMEYINDFQYEN